MKKDETRDIIVNENGVEYLYKIKLDDIANKNRTYYKLSNYIDVPSRLKHNSEAVTFFMNLLKKEIPFFNRLMLENSIKEYLSKNVIIGEIDREYIDYSSDSHFKLSNNFLIKKHCINQYEYLKYRFKYEIYTIDREQKMNDTIFNIAVHQIVNKENISVSYSEILEEIERYNDFKKDKISYPNLFLTIDKNHLNKFQITKIKNEILRRKVMNYLIEINSKNERTEPTWEFELGMMKSFSKL